MKKLFVIAMSMVLTFGGMSLVAQEAAAPAAPAAPAVEQSAKELPSLEGLTEEQIIALLKGMEFEDILRLLNSVMKNGNRQMVGSFLGAMNQYMSTLAADTATQLAQQASAQNPELGFGYSKNGKPLVFVNFANKGMNDNAALTRQGNDVPAKTTDGASKNKDNRPDADEDEEEDEPIPPVPVSSRATNRI